MQGKLAFTISVLGRCELSDWLVGESFTVRIGRATFAFGFVLDVGSLWWNLYRAAVSGSTFGSGSRRRNGGIVPVLDGVLTAGGYISVAIFDGVFAAGDVTVAIFDFIFTAAGRFFGS